ncbi:hypothetical protein CMI37_18660 [Candidatus Pacearchaeota archaeon]|nr:hypothetical protein [Candidatus Pacearchaeota archaeon]|tara:strand:+ start:4419 stop:4718 length:300 start_codon:yes stop_codon:yes gene_type:complete
MTDKKLRSGRKVKLKSMSVDQMDECTDIPEIVFKDGAITSIKNSSKARSQWIRYGLGGGDFKNYLEVNGIPTDDTIKQMTLEEKDELMGLIQEAQTLGE